MLTDPRFSRPALTKVEFASALADEIARHRYSGLPFSLVVASEREYGTVDMIQLARRVRDQIRLADEVGLIARREIAVLLPYTSHEGAWKVVDKIVELSRTHCSPPHCEVLEYPDDQSAIETRFLDERPVGHAPQGHQRRFFTMGWSTFWRMFRSRSRRI